MESNNNEEKAKKTTGRRYISEQAQVFPKLHKCIMLHYKTKTYIGKIHCFSFPLKGELVAIPYDDETFQYKVKKREFTANTLDRSMECTLYLKPIKTSAAQ